MSQGVKCLHSHSALERNMLIPKSKVICDYEYRCLFNEDNVTAFKDFAYKGKKYIIVPIALFVKNRGVFLNLKV